MTTHVRQQILEAAAALLTGLPTAGANVFMTRKHIGGDAKLPALLLYLGNEPVQRATIGFPGTQQRALTLFVRAIAKGVHDDAGNDNMDAQHNAMLFEVESAFSASKDTYTLGGLARLGVQAVEVAEAEIEEAQQILGAINIPFVVTYLVASNALDTAL